MLQRETPQKYWNIFAYELNKLLRNHDRDLGQLESEIGVQREKVRRLQQSLMTPTSLPILSYEEIEVLTKRLHFSEEESLQIRAALLATSMQRLLCERIEPEAARLAAAQLLPTLYQALIEQARTSEDLRTGDIAASEDSEIDRAFKSILEAIDYGEEALQLSYRAISRYERVKRANHAKASFESACTQLTQVNRHIKQLPQWKIWMAEAEKGKKSAIERLEELGS